ncbi:hypothetical protein [Burkholderia pyrrocinia]|uniref:hypothetical protein n=1 Tax=Burkholderia pyrrocinia TaxID=60550 RepID=UPI001ABB7272|nr:hypothetical protein [Burkholderia pyrrocinia]
MTKIDLYNNANIYGVARNHHEETGAISNRNKKTISTGDQVSSSAMLARHQDSHIQALSQLNRIARQSTSSDSAITQDKSTLNNIATPQVEIKQQKSKPNLLYNVNYTIPAPKGGLSNITYPIRIDNGKQRKSSKDDGIYYAMQFKVVNGNGQSIGRGYIGLQPREDGKALVMFSGFGSDFSAPSGLPTADSGPGAHNSTLIDFQYGHTYNLTVERDSKNPRVFHAYAQDVTDLNNPGPKKWVKDLHVNQDAGLAGYEKGFVELYGGTPIDSSAQIAPTSGSFSAPFTIDEKGTATHGWLWGSKLQGRFCNSTTGSQTQTKENGKTKKIELSIQGVGYPKNV